jgi:hypothetical protein
LLVFAARHRSQRPRAILALPRGGIGESTEVNALDAPATYLNWNFILISIPNVLVIIGMIAIFVVALIAPFPVHGETVQPGEDDDE